MNNSIKQAAKLAGVSVASVSRALNGKAGISEKTRQKILKICEEIASICQLREPTLFDTTFQDHIYNTMFLKLVVSYRCFN